MWKYHFNWFKIENTDKLYYFCRDIFYLPRFFIDGYFWTDYHKFCLLTEQSFYCDEGPDPFVSCGTGTRIPLFYFFLFSGKPFINLFSIVYITIEIAFGLQKVLRINKPTWGWVRIEEKDRGENTSTRNKGPPAILVTVAFITIVPEICS